MATHDRRKNLVLHASNYIVHLYPTAQEHAPMLIVVTAYSDSVTISKRVLASTFSLSTTLPTTRRPALRPVLTPFRVQAVTLIP